MASAYVLKKNDAGKFRFNLRAGNNEIILTSESYESKGGAENGIESARVNSQIDARYDRLTAKDGSPYFNLTAANGQTIGRSEMYSSASARDKGIESVKANGKDAPVVDQT